MTFDWWPPDGPWPSTPGGGLRGPDGRTLTDLHDIIGDGRPEEESLLSVMRDIRDGVQQLAGDLRALIGPPLTAPPLWPGLFNYLNESVAPINSGEGINSIHTLLTLLAEGDEKMLLALFGTTNPTTLSRWGALLGELAGQSGLLGAIEDDTTTAANALVGGGSVPVGSSVLGTLYDIRDYTRRSAECCEEGGVVDPPDEPVNDPPEGACGGGELIRTDGWILVGQVEIEGEDYDLLAPTFDALTDDILQYLSSSGNPGVRWAEDGSDRTALVCLAWNFTGGTLPLGWGRDKSTNWNAVADSLFVGTPVLSGGATLEIGSYSDELDENEFGDSEAVAYKFAFPAGFVPPNNVWFTYGIFS